MTLHPQTAHLATLSGRTTRASEGLLLVEPPIVLRAPSTKKSPFQRARLRDCALVAGEREACMHGAAPPRPSASIGMEFRPGSQHDPAMLLLEASTVVTLDRPWQHARAGAWTDQGRSAQSPALGEQNSVAPRIGRCLGGRCRGHGSWLRWAGAEPLAVGRSQRGAHPR